jgi:hypothetical protein
MTIHVQEFLLLLILIVLIIILFAVAHQAWGW